MNTDRIILPPDYPEVDGPLVFTAGPIQGAPDWHESAFQILHRQMPDLWIASPKRPIWNEEFDYYRQVEWEWEHLAKAANNGVILFWLAREATHDPSRAYAQTSRVEYGMVSEWNRRDGAKVVIGVDEGYSGGKYARYLFGQRCPNVPICSNLEETCSKAVELLQS